MRLHPRICSLQLVLALVATADATQNSDKAANASPNIMLIICDDLDQKEVL
jgi:hypothetical protein